MKTRSKAIALVLGVLMCGSVFLTACDRNTGVGEYTYREFVTQSPSNWNELTYQDNNDLSILGRINSNLFEYDYTFDDDGKILSGQFDIEYSMATKLEDVSATVDEKWGIEEGEKARAWEITIREDAKWQNGDAIKAEDFVYSMKQQLDPKFLNYRADSYYVGATVISGAKNYVKQGQSGTFRADEPYSVYSTDLDEKLVFWPIKNTLNGQSITTTFAAWAKATTTAGLSSKLGNYGVTVSSTVLDSMIGKTLTQIKADSTMKAAWEQIIGFWQTEPNEELHFFAADYTFPVQTFDSVGFYSSGEYSFVLVLDLALPLMKEGGELSYLAAYNLASLPLVHKATYEANKVAPASGATLWTSKYNSSVKTTMAYGPYKLSFFQSGKQFILVKNDKWFGYSDPKYAGQYQTTKIICDTIVEYSTAFMSFEKGKLDEIGIDVDKAADYKNSPQAFFTPSDFTGSIQIQSNVEAMKERETAGYNKSILKYDEFRKAMSLAVDRVAYNAACTTSSLKGFGLYGPIHYYDVANAGVYRDTDCAKETLLETYGFSKNVDNKWTSGSTVYETLDLAYAAITGFDLAQAKVLVSEAYNQALAAGDIKAGDTVKLAYGAAAATAAAQRACDFLEAAWLEMCKGTALEGKFELEFDGTYGDNWAEDFRDGKYDICQGGWTGAAWDPGYFLLAYLSPAYMYSMSWPTDTITMTFTMPGYNEDNPITMTLMEWYGCLNGSGEDYDWSASAVENEVRLPLIAALEKQILLAYYTVPISYSYTASLLSFKVEYASREYNTFMAYGGLRYMTFNYDDAEWAKFCKQQSGGNIDYK